MESDDKAQESRRYTQYREICHILTEAGRLTAKKFHNAENKEELIEKLKHSIAQLNGLLVEFEYQNKMKP
jgi:hypothetical protein